MEEMKTLNQNKLILEVDSPMEFSGDRRSLPLSNREQRRIQKKAGSHTQIDQMNLE